MPLLTDEQLSAARTDLPAWSVENGMLVGSFTFDAGFMRGIRFVDAVADAAEAADHHPDIDIRWTTVTIRVVTHSEGGITEKDVALAHACDRLAADA
jgi:4a-hydroxytetrahydrobiopterin dehydratase